jgi:uncharacterized protein YPO0396
VTTELQDTLFSLEEKTDDGGTPPGFRLHRLELLNWGTFHQGVRTFRLDGANSLLTGDIGSGKSTVVDAITTLLLPANRIEYNKAAGAQKKERSLMSYVRGFHKSTRSTGGEYSKPVALRSTGALTVVLAVFHNAVLGKSVTLAITLWATQEAGQPSRFYSLAEADQSIAADFSNFGQDPAKLKKKLRAAGAAVHDTFEPYAAAFKRQFGISGNQAMELFHRTVSMKQVENITSFVRTNMLEEDNVAERIGKLIHHFDDLKKAHEAVLRAKDQIALLTPIKEGAAQHAKLSHEDELARQQRDQLHPWFTDRKLQLSLEHQAELERTGERLQEDSTKLRTEITGRRHELSAVQEDIRTNGGGRLAAIDADIARLAVESRTQRQRFDTYAEAAKDLGLRPPEDRVLFDANKARLGEVEDQLGEQSNELQESRTELTITRTELNARLTEIGKELRSLQSRPNLLPLPQLELRRRLCDGTGIAEAALPYAGELLRVRDGEGAWEGAAERTLHGFALSLLVPAEHYAAVSSWVDANNLKGRLVYLRIGESPAARAAERARWPRRSRSSRARRSATSCWTSSPPGSTMSAATPSRTSAATPRRSPSTGSSRAAAAGTKRTTGGSSRTGATLCSAGTTTTRSAASSPSRTRSGASSGSPRPSWQRSTRHWVTWAGRTSSSAPCARWRTSARSAGSSRPGGSRSSRRRSSSWRPRVTC